MNQSVKTQRLLFKDWLKRKLPGPVRQWFLVAVLWQLVACASVTPTYSARAHVDPSGVKHQKWVDDAYDVDDEATEGVELWEKGQVPAGITLLEEGSDVEIARAFAGKYEPIGYVAVDLGPARESSRLRGWFWTWKYEQKWRRYLCWPQVPLRYLTLFAWRLMPTNYLCEVRVPRSNEDARELLTRRAKAIAKAMGGNTLVLTEELSRIYDLGSGVSAKGWEGRVVKMLDVVKGVVIRDKMFDASPTSVGDSVEDSAGKVSAGQEGS